MMRLIVLSLFGVIFLAAITYEQESAYDRLFKQLMSSYQKSVKAGSPNDTTMVTFSLTIICVEHDGLHGRLKTYAWQYMSWNDTRLRWNPDEFDSATRLSVPSEHLWIPDVVLYNKRDFQLERARAVIHSDGDVTVVFPVIFTTSASVGSNSTIIAQYKFGSWTYDGNKIDFVEKDSFDKVDLSNYLSYDDNCYQVVSHESRRNVVMYPCCTEPYVDINITLHLLPTEAIAERMTGSAATWPAHSARLGWIGALVLLTVVF